VLQAILLHLLCSALQPTLDAFQLLTREGSLPRAQEHLCIGFDDSIDARAPAFWSAACWCVSHQGASAVPKLLEDAVPHIVTAAKSVALLRARRDIVHGLSAPATEAPIVHRCVHSVVKCRRV
jgi:hypothetical protein